MCVGADTYVLRHVLQNVGLQGHVHIDGAGDPTQLALADVENAVDMAGFLAAYDCAVPGFSRDGVDCGFDRGEAQEVDVGILLLVGTLLWEGEGR